jgi:hypothetical protein
MFSTAGLQIGLTKICKDILGENVTEVIVAEQAAPRPKNPYVSLKVLGTKQVGSANWRVSDSVSDMFDIITDNELLVSFSAYGATAQDIIFTLVFHLVNNLSVSDNLSALRLSLSEKPVIVDRTMLLETKFEQRRMCTARFTYVHVETVDYGVIEHITVDSTYKEGSISGTTVLTGSVTVDKP